MKKPLIKILTVTCFFTNFTTHLLRSQSPGYTQDVDPTETQTQQQQQEPAMTLANLEIKYDELPLIEGALPWGRVTVTFDSLPQWNDEVYLQVEVLLKQESRFRASKREVGFFNIPKGKNRFFFYVTPNTTKRFGGPVAIHASLGGITTQQAPLNATWTKPGEIIREDWRVVYSSFSGLLLPLHETPWLFKETANVPDIRR